MLNTDQMVGNFSQEQNSTKHQTLILNFKFNFSDESVLLVCRENNTIPVCTLCMLLNGNFPVWLALSKIYATSDYFNDCKSKARLFFIYWITLHELKFFRSAIGEKNHTCQIMLICR